MRQNFKSHTILCPLFLYLFKKPRNIQTVLRIRNRNTVWLRDPGWVKNQDPDPRAYKQFFWLKKFKSLMRIRNPESFWPRIQDGKFRIGDKHPGSATLHSNLVLTVLDWNNVSLGHREDPAEYKYEDDEDSNDEDNVRDVMLHQIRIPSLTKVVNRYLLILFLSS